MEFLEKKLEIKKYDCTISVTQEKDGHLNHCKVVSEGHKRKNNWSHIFPSVYGGYAMLMSKHFFDLPGKRFLLQQINEHSRGGHYEYELYLLDMSGKVLNQFAGGYHSKLLLDDKYIWFLDPGKNPSSLTSDRDINLIKLNYNTGKIKQSINLNYPEILKCSYSYIITVSLSIKHNKGVLQIKYSDNTKETRTKRTLLNDI